MYIIGRDHIFNINGLTIPNSKQLSSDGSNDLEEIIDV